MDLFLALSVHRFVTSVGSYAGFAAIVGLAILILLFFAQARETNALRDHVDELLERIAGFESRLARQAQAQASPLQEAARVAAAAPAALAAVGRTGAANVAFPPAPPAGVAAPALSAATRVIPLPGPAVAVGARGAAGSGGGGVATAPGPATSAGANGSHATPVAAPNGGTPSGPHSANRPAAASSPRPAAAPATAGARRPPARPGAGAQPPSPRRFSRGRVALILGLLVVVAGAAVAIVLISSKASRQPSSVASHQTTRRVSNSTAQVNPRTVTVAVLNGTATAGLAHRTSQRLVALGYVKGAVTTAADQTRTSTTVAYIPGARAQALAVAQALKLGSASVAPVDQGTRTVACGGSATCTASVFVTVGSDLANQ